MHIEPNPHRGTGLDSARGEQRTGVSTDAGAVRGLLDLCPRAGVTPLVSAPRLAAMAGVGDIAVKDERERMGLGSFKALGAAYVIAREAAARVGAAIAGGGTDVSALLDGVTYVAASAGNHGLSVAAGARVFGARAVIYLSASVPEAFAGRLRALGAEVVRAGEDYEASMDAAMAAARDNGWVLLSDSSWPGYTEIPYRVMEGYLAMAQEAGEQLDADSGAPTHVFLQAGVGGLAAAAAACARQRWGEGPTIIVVEPQAAPALQASIAAGRGRARGRAGVLHGPARLQGSLNPGAGGTLAQRRCLHDHQRGGGRGGHGRSRRQRARHDAVGGAGLAGLLACDGHARERLGLDASSRVLAYLSEAAQ